MTCDALEFCLRSWTKLPPPVSDPTLHKVSKGLTSLFAIDPDPANLPVNQTLTNHDIPADESSDQNR